MANQTPAAKQQLSPALKAQLFAQATRQNWQPLPAQALVEGGSVSFNIPKVRLLSRVLVDITGTFKAAHATLTSLTKARFAPFSLVKQARMQINNGFNPYQVSGKGGYIYNSTSKAVDVVDAITTLGNTASVAGTTNSISMLLDLSTVLNDRDPVGLVLAQNQETVITVTLDFNTIAALFADAGITISSVAVNVTPIVETYSIPAAVDAIPDLSVLKLVMDQAYSIAASGSTFYIKMPVGLTYRKILLNFEDGSGAALTDAQIGNLSIVFNQADTPYIVPAAVLRKMNTMMYGAALPAGVLAFDFSYQGIPNLGGARDYIDTERLTEFWISCVPRTTGTVQVISETLARLAGV